MSNYYFANTEDITAIADAIRNVLETTDSLIFPDGFTEAINGLAASGLPDGVSAIACGTISFPSQVATEQTITHGLGVAPNFAIIMISNTLSIADLGGTLSGANVYFQTICPKSVTSNQAKVISLNGTGATTYQAVRSTYLNADNFRLFASTSYPFTANTKYTWVCGVLDDVTNL